MPGIGPAFIDIEPLKPQEVLAILSLPFTDTAKLSNLPKLQR